MNTRNGSTTVDPCDSRILAELHRYTEDGRGQSTSTVRVHTVTLESGAAATFWSVHHETNGSGLTRAHTFPTEDEAMRAALVHKGFGCWTDDGTIAV